MREELGDLLLQVVFHARLAQEDEQDPFDLDDVARGVAAKLVRRHPHVFANAGSPPHDDDAVQVQWDRIKTADKQRTSVLDGIPLAQGALARGQKVLSRARRAGLAVTADASAVSHVATAGQDRSAAFGARLLLLAAEADAAGVDAEAALRAALRTLEAAVRAAEAG
jgi:XTP/dITP diphosphohydrolase